MSAFGSQMKPHVGEFCLLFFVAFGCIVEQAGAACDEAAIQRCLVPLTGAQVQSGQTLSESQMDNLCHGLPGVKPCLARAGCPVHIMMAGMWQGLTAGFEYLCGDGRQVYMQGQDCMHADDYQSPMMACNFTYIQAVSTNIHSFCSATGSFTKCIRTALHASCGEEFATVYLTFFKRYTTPIITEVDPGCTIDYYGQEGATYSSSRARNAVRYMTSTSRPLLHHTLTTPVHVFGQVASTAVAPIHVNAFQHGQGVNAAQPRKSPAVLQLWLAAVLLKTALPLIKGATGII